MLSGFALYEIENNDPSLVLSVPIARGLYGRARSIRKGYGRCVMSCYMVCNTLFRAATRLKHLVFSTVRAALQSMTCAERWTDHLRHSIFLPVAAPQYGTGGPTRFFHYSS